MITLLDTITPGALKGTPIGDAYAGYVGGHWPDYEQIVHEYPGHYFLSYAVAPGEVAEFCDCEAGDFNPGQVVAFLKDMHNHGIWRPGVYAPADELESQVLPLVRRSLPRAMYRIIGALWNGQADIPAGWDGHQYQDHGLHGENYDMTVVRNDFFPAHARHNKPHAVPDKLYKATVTLDPDGEKWTVTGA